MYHNGNIMVIVVDTTISTRLQPDVYLIDGRTSKIYSHKNLSVDNDELSKPFFLGDTVFIQAIEKKKRVTYYYDPKDFYPRKMDASGFPINLFNPHYQIGDKIFYRESQNASWQVWNKATRKTSAVKGRPDLGVILSAKSFIRNSIIVGKRHFLHQPMGSIRGFELVEFHAANDSISDVIDPDGNSLFIDEMMDTIMAKSPFFSFKNQLCYVKHENGDAIIHHSPNPDKGWDEGGAYNLGSIKISEVFPMAKSLLIADQSGALWVSDGTAKGTGKFDVDGSVYLHTAIASKDGKRAAVRGQEYFITTDGTLSGSSIIQSRHMNYGDGPWRLEKGYYLNVYNSVLFGDYSSFGTRSMNIPWINKVLGATEFRDALYVYSRSGLHKQTRTSDIMRIHTFFDANENGTKDSGEKPMPGQKVVLPNGAQVITSKGGFGLCVLSEDMRTKDVSFSLLPSNGLKALKNKTVFKLRKNEERPDTMFFPMVFLNTGKSHYEFTANRSRFRCSSGMYYKVNVANIGEMPRSGKVTITLADSLTYKGCSEENTNRDGQILTVVLDELQSLERRTFLVYAQVPDFRSMGDWLTTEFVFDPSDGESQKIVRTDVVRCSYDPNDKASVYNGASLDSMVLINDTAEFTYTIRFQNYGNDDAYRVVVRDTLSKQLDLSSFEFESASHENLKVNIDSATREVVFDFYTITLPPKSVSELGSQGYIVYTVKPNKGLKHNTMVRNTARIFFDFNPAVVTNTTLNTMVKAFPSRNLRFTKGELNSRSAIDMAWEVDLFGVDSFELERREDAGTWMPIGHFPTSQRTYVDSLYRKGVDSITYRIRTYNQHYASAWDEVVVDLIPTNQKEFKRLTYQLYPIPNKGVFHVRISTELNSASGYQYKLLSTTGKIEAVGVLTPGFSTLDVSDLPAGMYLFEIKSQTETSTRQVVIQK